MPRCSLGAQALYAFLSSIESTRNVAAARKRSAFALSLSSAYRWLKAFTRQMPYFRSMLYRIHATPPLEDDTLTPFSLTLRAFEQASHPAPEGRCLAFFQRHFQMALF